MPHEAIGTLDWNFTATVHSEKESLRRRQKLHFTYFARVMLPDHLYLNKAIRIIDKQTNKSP